MINKQQPSKKRNDGDITSKVIGGLSEETEKFTESVVGQISGSAETQEEDPIKQAMQQKTEEEEMEKQNKLDKQKKFIRTRQELDDELKQLQQKAAELEKARNEEIERQFKIVDPGESMEEKPVVLTSKPKRGQMPGRPGTAKGETGMEVRKSKQ